MDRIQVEQFLRELTRWAAGQANIQAVALVGSHARGTATETSDVDLVVIANQPQVYLQERTWVRAFGEVVNEQVEDYGRLISLRVRYVNGLEVEYGLTNPGWADIPLDNGTRQVISGGMRVLFDRRPPLLSTN